MSKRTPVLTLELDNAGVIRARSSVTTISEANAAARLLAKTAQATRLLHSMIREDAPIESYDCPPFLQIWVPRDEAGDGDFLPCMLAVGQKPRDIYDRMPKFLEEALAKIAPHRPDEEPIRILGQLLMDDESWLDQAGYGHDEWLGDFLVSEPMNLSSAQIQAIEDFCSKGDLEYRISGTCFSWPSGRLRIEIWKASPNLPRRTDDN